MRKALNDNPMVQVAVLGVLALVVGFLLITRVASSGSDSGASPASATNSASAAPGATTAPEESTPAPSPTTPEASATAPIPATDAAAPAAPVDAAAEAAAAGEFVAGPGLPASVVKAYADNKVVVVLIVRRLGIDDEALREMVEQQQGSENVALFVTNAGHISRYSRITQGVNVDRVPALIVLQPRELTKGVPVASVSYGFRGPESVAQAIDDALYKGPTNLPSYPK